MTKAPRPTQPRVWTSLALATVTLAASPAVADLRPAPVTLAMPQARIWLAQAEGGEAGEAGITAEAPEDSAYLAELMIIQGHMQAARDLYAMGEKDKAVELSKHPQEEGTLAALQAQIAKYQAQDVADEIAALTDTMAKGAAQADVDLALSQVDQAFAAAASVKDTEVRARFDAVVLLVKAAAGEYQDAITDGKVEDIMGWHEAWSFIDIARAQLQDLAGQPLAAKAAPKALKALEDVNPAFGDPMAAVPLAGDAQILLGVAAKLELIASSVR